MNINLGVRIPTGQESSLAEEILIDKFPYITEMPVSEIWTFFDTFDWRLFKKNLTLHLRWEKDEIRPRFVRWVMDSIEFGVKMFWNRREGR